MLKICYGAVLWALIELAMPAQAAPIQLISLRDASQPPTAGGGGDSYAPLLSADGRYVLFASSANNLALNTNGDPIPLPIPPRLNVYLRDRTNGTNALVSVNLTGTGGGNGDSLPTAISTNGRYALFESSASDLVPGDTNNVTDIFVRDLVNGITLLVSASTNGGVANGVCRGSVMTTDGRYVAFVSEASNLVANDTNKIADVFLRDLQSGTATLISAGAKSTSSTALSASSESPDITPDGRFVAFHSTATNLVPGITNSGEVYLRDVIGGTTIWASTNSRTLMQSVMGTTSAISYNQAVSADGKFVAFEVSRNPPPSISVNGLILRYSLDTGLTDLVKTNGNVAVHVAYSDIRSLDMTPDGRFIVFVGNTNGSSATPCVYLWDATSGTASLVSGDLSNNVPVGSICDRPAIDSSGRFVAFLSSAANLVTNSLAGAYHLYVRDMQAGTTTLVDADTNGVGVSVEPATAPRMSSDGRFVAFECLYASLVPNDNNHAYDVFVRDLTLNSNELISARNPALPSTTAAGPSGTLALSASTDGWCIAFSSEADNLVPNDTNGLRDIFVWSRPGGSNFLVSVSTNGAAADGISSEPSINASGRYVAFTSSADNLVSGDANHALDVFVRDLQTSTTVLVSVDSGGLASGNKASYAPLVSPDGRFVLFRSKATNLGPGPFSGTENLFLRNLQSGTTYSLTTSGVFASVMTPNGQFVAFSAGGGNIHLWDMASAMFIYTNSANAGDRISVSPDGQRIAYLGSLALRAIDRLSNSNWLIASPVPAAPRAGLRFTADGRFLVHEAASAPYTSQQVFVYDFDTGTNALVSQAFDGSGGGNGDSDSPEISPDGRWVTYRSTATNLVAAADTNGVPDLYLYDRLNGLTTLLTASRYGGAPADNRSIAPVFSGDGHTLLFQSWASDLVSLDFNQGGDVFSLNLLYASIVAANPGPGRTLTWPARPGETYHVQFKTNLSDSDWHEATGTVTITGGLAQFTDLAPAAGQRFYRIVVN